MDQLSTTFDDLDRRIVVATQEGLPLCPRPYDELAERLGVSAAEIMSRLETMLAAGVIRRMGAIPNHYALGYRANGMSVWDVRDEELHAAGKVVGALDFVTHCYHRPRRPPAWPYNLFAMVHGHDRDEVEQKVAEIADILKHSAGEHDVLYSTAILKKTGLRIAA
ncbi:MAG TPA: AsnC family transcriptional regulator [Gammaproteobacteria bacterium]|jgi:DNA-binding Lrp family transcriptional regulator|nr:AsnC family transcriptional regulator [Gammaproteobacteria bacterium]